MATQVMSRFSYPKVPGDTPWSILDATGPASYVAVLPVPPAAPPVGDEPAAEAAARAAPTGGQTITAADFGLQSLDWVGAMGSDNTGTYSVSVVPGDFNLGAPLDYVLLLWFDAATGAESADGADLSGSTVRLLAIGR